MSTKSFDFATQEANLTPTESTSYKAGYQTPAPIQPLQGVNNNPCCDCERTLFQNLLPLNNGQCPPEEGAVLFTQLVTAPIGTTVAGVALKPAKGFFLLFIGTDNQTTGAGSTAFTRIYPLNSADAATWSPLQMDGAIDASTIPFKIPVSSSQMIVPYVKAGGAAIGTRDATIYALHLRDCPNNWDSM